MQNNILRKYAQQLKKEKFDNFTIKDILICYSKNEVIVVTGTVNNDVLDEFFSKTFDYAYKKDNDVVFMITTEDSVRYLATLQYDGVFEDI